MNGKRKQHQAGRLARKLLNPNKAPVVNSLIRKRVTDIVYTGDKIEFTYDGHRLKYKVVEKQHLGWVGWWDHGKGNILYYDNDVSPRDRVPLLVHEGIEAYAAKRKGLSAWVDAHYVATAVENKVVKQLGLDPTNYSWRMEKVYRTEMPKDKIRRKTKLQQ